MATIGLQWMDGFEFWNSITEFAIGVNASGVRWGTSSQGVTATGNDRLKFVAGGRQGTGQYLALGVDSNTISGFFDARVRALFSTGAVSSVSDGAQFCCGFNAYLGLTGVSGLVFNTGATASGGYCRVFGFTANSDIGNVTGGITNQRVTFYYNQGTNSFAACYGTGTPPGGTGTPLVPFATGTPSRNPFGQWTYFEMRVYRSAASGQVDLWIENSGGTLDHVIAATSQDTSVTTRGAIACAALCAGWFSATVNFPVGYDDFWLALATGNDSSVVATVGVPSYVLTVAAAAESTQSGATWTASSGANNATVVATLPVDFSTYTSFPLVTGTMNTATILFTQAALPYTPLTLAAIQSVTIMDRVATTSGNTAVAVAQGLGRIRKGVTDYDGPIATLSAISGSALTATAGVTISIGSRVLEQDPDTSAAWNPATANSVIFGPAVSGHITTTGSGVWNAACFGAYMTYLASIASGAAVPPGGPAAGYGQPFWLMTA